MRNKDEFYFGMINSSTRNGVHQHARPSEVLENDVVALLKTQDVGYVRQVIVAEKKRIRGWWRGWRWEWRGWTRSG